jgi:hypothetical protein
MPKGVEYEMPIVTRQYLTGMSYVSVKYRKLSHNARAALLMMVYCITVLD